MLGDDLLFASDDETEEQEQCLAAWKVLIVDDEPEIHSVTKMVLSDFEFEGRRIEFHTANSALEARALLEAQDQDGFAVALVDVVMESSQAGLDKINYHYRHFEEYHL